MRIVKPAVVQCKKCFEIIEIDADLNVVESDEKSMGQEIGYSSEVEDECPVCGNMIKIKMDVWEYPIGLIDYQEEQCSGAELLEQPVYDPFEEDDF